MARVLTGIQSTGIPHLGNILGAIKPAIELANEGSNEAFLFIADWHSLTTIKDAELRKSNVRSVAAAWLAFGLDTERNAFYRQSDVTEVAELTWYLNCFTPFPMLANAHSFKDKSERLADVNAGLFTYPVLMAADILLYNADIVPVGKDQLQHLEMTRDIAGSFNHLVGETLVVPKARVQKETMYIPGTDGQKMSKSYGNFIDIFQTDKKLRKNVMKIITDSKGVEDPKNPDECNVFNIYKTMAKKEEIADMRQKYEAGGFGYGHAKQELYELIVDRFGEEREKYDQLMSNPSEIEDQLALGAEKAAKVARSVIEKVREKLGY
ncbi:tryptophan--tRNA ligase [Cryomorphaceae bacterium 1068]|nr:tryptophan--tRNA ligase [Cryomorphaceae bacterium 1068]